MPSYDYRCKSCDHVFTIEKSMTDSTIPDCPECSSLDIARIWGNIQLKGCSSKGSSGPSCGSCSGGSCSGCGK